MHTLAELRRRLQGDKGGDADALFDHLEARVYEDVDYTETGQLRLDLKKLATGTIEVGSGLVPFGPALAGLVKGAGKLVGGKGDEKNSADVAKLDANGVNKLLDSVRRERIEVHKRRIQYTEEFQREFEGLVQKHVCDREATSEKRLVVFIDDLDRCLPEKVIQVLEAIKLFLEVKNTVFVVGVASEVVHRGIERWYGFKPGDLVDDGGKAFSGTDYLEKIIQLPFRLPTIDAERFQQFLEEHGRLLPEGCCELLALGMPPNPRKAKRTLNVFGLLLRLGEVRLEADLDPRLLAKVCVIQTRWPHLYKELVEFPVEMRRLENLCKQLEEEESVESRQREPHQVSTEELSEETPDRKADSRKDTEPVSGTKDNLYRVAAESRDIRRMMAREPSMQDIPVDILKRHFHLSVSGAVDTLEREKPTDSPLFEQLVDDDDRVRREALAIVKDRIQSEENEYKKELRDLARHIQDRVLDSPNCEYDARRRASALDALGLLGDPRQSVRDVDAMEFRRIPAGPFTMGSDEDRDNERPQHECHRLDYDYEMARFPVTVAQFAQFVDQTGHEPEDRDCLEGIPNHPVVWVSWHEALKFCDWLTKRWREQGRIDDTRRVMLPSEAEWEKAARGTKDARRWPWSDEGEPAERMNCLKTGIGTSSAAGCFPDGANPETQCEDMAGNVWEWTRSLKNDYPYDPKDGRENLAADDDKRRVLRGGSFNFDLRIARCSVRDWDNPYSRLGDVGFRVCLSPFAPSGV